LCWLMVAFSILIMGELISAIKVSMFLEGVKVNFYLTITINLNIKLYLI